MTEKITIVAGLLIPKNLEASMCDNKVNFDVRAFDLQVTEYTREKFEYFEHAQRESWLLAKSRYV